MFNLFKNFITAIEAKESSDKAYRKKQKEIRDSIEEDILKATEEFKYSKEYFHYEENWYDNDNRGIKINFILEHEQEFKDMGYTVSCESYRYIETVDKETGKMISRRVNVPVDKATSIRLTLSWANKK